MCLRCIRTLICFLLHVCLSVCLSSCSVCPSCETVTTPVSSLPLNPCRPSLQITSPREQPIVFVFSPSPRGPLKQQAHGIDPSYLLCKIPNDGHGSWRWPHLCTSKSQHRAATVGFDLKSGLIRKRETRKDATHMHATAMIHSHIH